MSDVVVVFVPGAFVVDTGWWWASAARLLEERGIASRTVEYPSCGPSGPLGDLLDDAAAVHAVLDEIDGRAILVGHSYGGMVITQAGDHPKVAHLVYMSAFVPDGTSAAEADFMKPEDLEGFELFEDGTAGEGGTKSPIIRLLGDPELVDGALSRLARQSVQPAIQAPSVHAWRQRPSTFFVLTGDDDIAVENQRAHAQRTGGVVEIATNHYAHLERPDLVATALADIAAALPAPDPIAAD
jgi:pimeloyl-ACP methyl ester carboxylesterase